MFRDVRGTEKWVCVCHRFLRPATRDVSIRRVFIMSVGTRFFVTPRYSNWTFRTRLAVHHSRSAPTPALRTSNAALPLLPVTRVSRALDDDFGEPSDTPRTRNEPDSERASEDMPDKGKGKARAVEGTSEPAATSDRDDGSMGSPAHHRTPHPARPHPLPAERPPQAQHSPQPAPSPTRKHTHRARIRVHAQLTTGLI